LGVGVDIEHKFDSKNGVRLNINGIKISRDDELDDIEYDLDFDLFTAGILYDYYPYETNFRLTTGLYYNKNEIEGSAMPSNAVKLGNIIYDPDEIGKLTAKIDYDNKIAPYFGIGWSSKAKNGWQFTADIGAMYTGKPRVTAEVTPGSTINALPEPIKTEAVKALNESIAKETEYIYEDVKDYKWWPVLMIGVKKKF
jgi:hypothetical protein